MKLHRTHKYPKYGVMRLNISRHYPRPPFKGIVR